MVTRSGPTSNTERRSGAVKGVNTLRSRRVSTVSVCSVSAPAQPLAAQIGPPIDRCAVIVRAPAQRSRPPWASSTRDSKSSRTLLPDDQRGSGTVDDARAAMMGGTSGR
jgi:hypothetical protein